MTIHPLRDLMLAKRYQLPSETLGGLLVPDVWRQRNDLEIWEVIRGVVHNAAGMPLDLEVEIGPKVEEVLGAAVQAGDIVLTPPYRGVWAGDYVLALGANTQPLRLHLGYDVFWLSAAALEGRVSVK